MYKPNADYDYAPVLAVDFSSYDRVIAISDIHGDYDGFQGVLNKLSFTCKDALVIVGDILEKGSKSLKLLREVMQCMKQSNFYMVIGNNDVILEGWYTGRISNEDVWHYLHSRDKSIFIDMANELWLPYETLDDIAQLKTAIETYFPEELHFLNTLPYIIDSEIATFVHAGVKPGDLYTQDKDYCLAAKSFGKRAFPVSKEHPEQIYRFEKPLIVGHWPTSNYRETIIDINPYINHDTNVYSIDGGNSMKKWQQINYLIFEKDGTIVSGSFDTLPKIKVLEGQTSEEEPITLTFPNTFIEIREKGEKKSLCYLPCVKKELEILNSFIYTYKSKPYCSDFTTYHLPVEKDEIVTFCCQTNDGIFIKRNGIVGKYCGEYEFIDEISDE